MKYGVIIQYYLFSFWLEISDNINCNVLLDLAHTIISAHNLNMDVIDFVEKMGINRVYEVHVNSPLYKDGEWYDIDEPFYYSEEAKRVLEHVIEKKKAKALNIECDENILKQVKMLREARENVRVIK